MNDTIEISINDLLGFGARVLWLLDDARGSVARTAKDDVNDFRVLQFDRRQMAIRFYFERVTGFELEDGITVDPLAGMEPEPGS